MSDEAEDAARINRQRLVDDAKTPEGGWTKASLAAFGVPWPPPRGWKETIIDHGLPYRHDMNRHQK